MESDTPPPAGPLGKLLAAFAAAERDALEHRLSPAGRRFDAKTVTVLLSAAVLLTVQNYTRDPAVFGLYGWSRDPAARLAWWAGVAVVTYLVVPAMVVRWAFGEPVRDYGLKWSGAAAGWPVYVAFAAVMLPLVWAFSADPGFRATYPFLPVAGPEDLDGRFVRWELLYAAQFVALEFFFRGFLVHGTRHRFGAYAVVVAAVPYCMIHFQKPAAECAASVVAGLALGAMSLATRSVWLGAALHIAVAWGMDFACLARRGLVW